MKKFLLLFFGLCLSVIADTAPSFKNDVLPVFMRAGCNAGDCHGAARGKDGFMLSLFGYDPAGDYHRITREIGSRRLNLALTHESMLMEKAIEHGANPEDFNLEEPEDDPKRRMPYRAGMVTAATGAGILLGARVYTVASEFNNLMMIGGVIVICVGVALLVNDFMNRDRFERE